MICPRGCAARIMIRKKYSEKQLSNAWSNVDRDVQRLAGASIFEVQQGLIGWHAL
jgi:hypothetical protein